MSVTTRCHPRRLSWVIMLTVIPPAAPLSDAVWIDLVAPTDDERARVERETKVRLPTKAAIEEIESSSRVFVEAGAYYLSTPVLETSDCLTGSVTVIGFVLSSTRLVTLRFSSIAAFDAVAASLSSAPDLSPSDVFLKVMETLVDRIADALEHANAELERISHAAFRVEGEGRSLPAKASGALRQALRKLGRMADGLSHVRGTLLGLGRIAAFLPERKGQGEGGVASASVTIDGGRAAVIRGDIASLNDYQAHLSNNLQFLLDATLGFINIEQNDIVKVLTVVSVVGVPPVLIAGIYGMNFKLMPELGWSFGYPYALALIVVSALVPVAWLKWRGWM